MGARRPQSPAFGRGRARARRAVLLALASLPLCIALYRLCSGGGWVDGSAARDDGGGGGGGERRRLGGDAALLELGVKGTDSLAAAAASRTAVPSPPPAAAADVPPAEQREPGGGVPPPTAVVAGAAAVHGFVRKEGPLDPQMWQPKYRKWRQERRRAWLDERQQRLAAGEQPPPLPFTHECQVFVNHRYRVIYLRHAKTGSSSLLCHFSGCRGGTRDAATSFVPLQAMPDRELEALWRDYLVVTFVRNAYTRAVSSYRMMMRNIVSPAIHDAYGWNQFCADPASFVDQCLADRGCSKKGAEFVYTHIQPQADCILAPGGGWAVDFIGRTEHIDADLSLVLEELEQRRQADVPPVKPLDHSLDNVNGRGCNETAQGARHAAREQYCEQEDYFRGPHAACLGAVSQQYHRDVAVLQFEPRSVVSGDATAAAGLGRAAGGSGAAVDADVHGGEDSLQLGEADDALVAAQARRLQRLMLS